MLKKKFINYLLNFSEIKLYNFDCVISQILSLVILLIKRDNNFFSFSFFKLLIILKVNNSIIGCQRRKDSIKYLDIYEYEKEKVIAENKYLIIEFYLTTTNNKIKEIINEDSIAMIKNGRINKKNLC